MGCGSSKVKEGVPELPKKEGIMITSSNYIHKNYEDFSKFYKLGELMGKGSFGKVYKVLHYQTNQLRAMKQVIKDKISREDEINMEKEIEVLTQLDHPNIIKIYEYFQSEKSYQIIVELATGGELFDRINELRVFSERDAAIVIDQLLSAVCYLHSKGIVHRDLKPENILMETKRAGDMAIKLIDFGAANYLGNGYLTLSIGTPYYIAPEVIAKQYNEKCDIWSIGVILFILLAGIPPFHGGTLDDDRKIIQSITKGEFTFDEKEWKNVSVEAKDLIKKMLTYDKNKRPSAETCLTHPWVQKYRSSREMFIDNKTRLNFINTRMIQSRHKLQQASIAYIVHQLSTNEVVRSLRNIFKKLDESGDGRLTYQELKDGWRKFFNDQMSEIEFDRLIKEMDQDGNNYIEYEEFLRATISTEILLSEKNLEMAFIFFDKDKSGKLSSEEIKFVLGIHSDDAAGMDLIKRIFEEVGSNLDGEICFEDFKKLMRKTVMCE
jgi:calcium-dependent protein kinase